MIVQYSVPDSSDWGSRVHCIKTRFGHISFKSSDSYIGWLLGVSKVKRCGIYGCTTVIHEGQFCCSECAKDCG